MVKEKIENPWRCNFCMKKFPKDNDGNWKKLQKVQFCHSSWRRSIFKHKDDPEHFIYGSKWLEHLYFRTDKSGDPTTGICPKSLCLHCLIRDGKLIHFENYGQYTYHKKKHCPYKNDSLKTLMATSQAYLDSQLNLENKELEKENNLVKKQQEQYEYFKKLREEKEEQLRKEEDFRSRARFYDAPPPRSQASIDREKKYKKCPKEIAIEEAMSI